MATRLALCDVRGLLTDLLEKLSGEEGDQWEQALKKTLRKENPWNESVVVQPSTQTIPAILDWSKTYEALGMLNEYAEFCKEFGVEKTPGLWTVPAIKAEERDQEGKVIGYKLTCNKVIATLQKLGVTVYSYYENIDKEVTVNDRDPNCDGSYTVSFRSVVEADEENANQSANQRRKQSCKDITLLERLLLELAYFLATGQNLDVKKITLCTGSRDSGGGVPCVNFYSGNREVYVYCCYPDSRGGYLRARSVVSCRL